MLTVGFKLEEVSALRQMLDRMGADFVRIIPCSEEMFQLRLFEAFGREGEREGGEFALGAKKTIFLSGLSGEEVVEVVAAYKDSGLDRSVFAAMLPANAEKTLEELMAEVHKDDALLSDGSQLE